MNTATLTSQSSRPLYAQQAKAMNSSLVTIDSLSVAFDGFKAVNDLSLDIAPNELRVIIGPNGAGKTTLLDIICGKTRPQQGRVMFKGVDLTTLEEHRIVRLGVVRKFQTPSVYEDLSVLENFEISIPDGRGVFGSLFFRRRAAILARIRDIAQQTFLEGSLEVRAKHLSHGQKQWLEIGMMLIQDPELLLLDEPVAGMSHHEREQTAELLTRIAAEKALIVIEHDMEFVRKIAKKITVMHQGMILCEGTVDEIQGNELVVEVYLGA